MSNSAFTNFLSSLRNSATPAKPVQAIEGEAKLLDVPMNVREEAKETAKPVKLRGEVVEARKDGTVRIRTDRGDVELKVPDGQRLPREGQSVEVEIPPPVKGQPQETVSYRRLAQSPAPSPQTEPPRNTSTPVDVQVRPSNGPKPESAAPDRPQATPLDATQNTPTTERPALPPQDVIVRLLAIAPVIQQSIPPFQPAEIIEAQAATPPLAPAPSSLGLPQLLLVRETVLSAQTPAPITPLTPEPLSQVRIDTLPQSALAPTPTGAELWGLNTKADHNSATFTAPLAAPPDTPLPPLFPATLDAANLLNTAQIVTLPDSNILAPGIASALVFQPNASAVSPALDQNAPPIPAQSFNAVLSSQPAAPVLLAPNEIKGEINAERMIDFTSKALHTPPADSLILNNQKAEALTGIVTNITADKLPIISVFFPQNSSEQSFALQYPSESITIGTQVHITPQAPGEASAALATQPLPTLLPLSIQLTPQPWPLMEEIMQTLQHASPQTAQAFSNILPNPSNPAQMAPALLFFVAAVRGGDLSNWLGEKAVETLRQAGKSSLLSRLFGEGSQMSRVAADPVSLEWRAVNVPMTYQGDIQKLALFYRHEYDDAPSEENDKRLKGTRFVFDLSLDAMGAVQVDGLFRPVSESGPRLDLVVRTQEFFSEATKSEMRRVYTSALRETGVGGELSFQSKKEFWVSVNIQDDHFAEQA